MSVIGIDIGTTTLSGIVVNSQTGRVENSITFKNKATMIGSASWEKIQNPQILWEQVQELLACLLADCNTPQGIGITGQMHGVLYCDEDGNAISSLYTWQDGRGDLPTTQGKSYAQLLSEKTGYHMGTGYGCTTHFYHLQNNMVPPRARVMCTIHDYIGMKLIGSTCPVTDHSDAASMGLFNLRQKAFDFGELQAAGISLEMLPRVQPPFQIIGTTTEGIPVAVAIGDNQASFIGSVQDMEHTVLLNIGTGSQISLWADDYQQNSRIELRPGAGMGYLQVGSPLCGGRAYALLESFFRDIAQMVGNDVNVELYEAMGQLAQNWKTTPEKLTCSTCFSGTREQPLLRGSIHGLSVNNFTPKHFTIAVLEGMVGELYDIYSSTGARRTKLVGSGNGIRKNCILREMLCDQFGMEMKIPAHKEEAAYGAAIYAMVAVGCYGSLEEAQHIIRYQ